MVNKSKTTILIEKQIRDELLTRKRYKRETYDEILKRLLKKKGGKY